MELLLSFGCILESSPLSATHGIKGALVSICPCKNAVQCMIASVSGRMSAQKRVLILSLLVTRGYYTLRDGQGRTWIFLFFQGAFMCLHPPLGKPQKKDFFSGLATKALFPPPSTSVAIRTFFLQK